MTVNVTGDLQAFIEAKLASGQYASAEEVVEAALSELRNIETGELDVRWLKAKIAVGQAQVDAGDVMSADEAMKRVREMTGTARSKVAK